MYHTGTMLNIVLYKHYFLNYGRVFHGVKNKATTVTMQTTDEYEFYFWNPTIGEMAFLFDLSFFPAL